MIEGELNAIVRQEFVFTDESTDLTEVRQFLNYIGFQLKKNNDYCHNVIGLILEELHAENVLSKDGILFFIDTIFYMMPSFYSPSDSWVRVKS